MKVYIAFFLVHICIVILMFDVYFQTKVITGLNPVKNFTKPYAKRLVLFVGDGLRSDTFFGNSKMGSVEHAPFLRSIMVEAASWGVSHTRVPTESRPGHVAIIAGFYEDPSAVFKGWKKNPVLFDSVFNQSVATFSWGSPDIVPMFSNELSNPNIFYYNYEEEDQDLSGRNGTVEFLNSWVFNKFEEMYNNISNNKFMRDLWNKPGIIFFFHFLGIDVAGHAFNPNSPGYLQSVRQTDALIRDITKMIEDYYNDNRTSFIFTSDHGMTDWGSHGAGSASETETPLVVWGAGIKHSHCNHFFTPDCFKNVSQADIAVLMSILLGRSIPVHSTGVLPIDYLDIPIHDKVMALFQNSHQLLNQFRQKEKDIKSNVAKILYTPFIGLEKDIIAFYFKRISEKMQSGLYDVALKITKEFIDLVIEGSDYYDRYYQTVKLIFLDLTVIGLIFCVLSEIVPLITISESDEELKQSKYSTINKFNFKLFALFIIILVSIYLLLLGSLDLLAFIFFIFIILLCLKMYLIFIFRYLHVTCEVYTLSVTSNTVLVLCAHK
ncbi:hypothetical protein O3M35_003750 [Rhynocoris fuscipes]|uniref:GPI ethanolamine phosphate transferase 1 n=1 Tax=Rhynocoris fuscipes TaxID=488301 RepID=A0AAW1CNI7_9HEMI